MDPHDRKEVNGSYHPRYRGASLAERRKFAASQRAVQRRHDKIRRTWNTLILVAALAAGVITYILATAHH